MGRRSPLNATWL